MPVIFNRSKFKKETTKKPGRAAVNKNPLASFLVSPLNIRFATQRDKEKILLLLRRHWITNVPWITTSVVAFFLPPIFFPTFFFLRTPPSFIPPNYFILGVSFWYLGLFGFTLFNFLIWYFNVNIVTNERIIDIDFIYLLYNEVTETRVNRVEDVTYRLGGLIRAIFNYGDVFIQTAGPEPNIEFLGVPKPAEVVKKIAGLIPTNEG